MSVRNDHAVRPPQATWQRERSAWHHFLGTRPRAARVTDFEGSTWTLLMPDEAGDVFTYRVWQSDHGMALLEPDLAGVLAWQDVHARRHGALGRAIRSAGSAIRWTALGLWRTPSVRVTGLVLGAAIVAGLVVTAGLSVAP